MKELGSLHKAQRKITVKLGKYLFNNCFGHKNPWTSLVKDALLVAILKKPDSSNIARYDDEKAEGIIRFFGHVIPMRTSLSISLRGQARYIFRMKRLKRN
jgi:hypothetical protein